MMIIKNTHPYYLHIFLQDTETLNLNHRLAATNAEVYCSIATTSTESNSWALARVKRGLRMRTEWKSNPRMKK